MVSLQSFRARARQKPSLPTSLVPSDFGFWHLSLVKVRVLLSEALAGNLPYVIVHASSQAPVPVPLHGIGGDRN